MASRTVNSARVSREGELGCVGVAAVSGESILLVKDARASQPHLWQLPRKRTYPMETGTETARRILSSVLRHNVRISDFDFLDTYRFGRQRFDVFLIEISKDSVAAFESREKNPEMLGKFFGFQEVLSMPDINNEDRVFLEAIATPEEGAVAKMPQTP